MMNRCFFYLMMLLIFELPFSGTCQSRAHVDSLKMKMKGVGERKKADLLIELGMAFVDRDNPIALNFFREAYRIAAKRGDSVLIVKSGRMVGQLLIRLDSLPEAIEFQTKMLGIAQRNRNNIEFRRIANSLATAYMWEANYFEALKYNFIALAESERQGDRSAASVSLNNIGLAYMKIENFRGALKYLQRSLEIKKTLIKNDDLSRSYINVGLCLIVLKEFEAAYKNISIGFLECAPECSDNIKIEGYLALGLYHKSLQHYKEAVDCFTISYTLAEKQGNRKFRIENLKSLARLHLAQGGIDKAITFLKKAEKIMEATAYLNIKAEVSQELANYYYRTRQYAMAARYYHEYVALSDSTLRKQTSEVNSIRSEFEEKENWKTIKSQNEILILKEEALINQRYLISALLVIALLLAIIIYIVRRQSIKKDKINLQLDRRVRERTQALDASYNDLLRVSKQQDIFLTHAFSDLATQLRTMKGLINLLILEPANSESVVQNARLMSSTSDLIMESLTRFKLIGYQSVNDVKPM